MAKYGKNVFDRPIDGPTMSDPIQMEAYNWVHKNDICLFLNGNRYGTTCKNSRGVLNILKYYAIRKFLDIDVTRSVFFKENLAMYSNWPTFP